VIYDLVFVSFQKVTGLETSFGGGKGGKKPETSRGDRFKHQVEGDQQCLDLKEFGGDRENLTPET